MTDATPPALRGYAYGFMRALDNGGAVGGSLIAAAVLAWSAITLTQMILLSAIPGLVAVLCLAVGVREPAPAVAKPELAPLSWPLLGQPMRRYLIAVGLFTVARASETFILLLGHERGASIVQLLLLWSVLSLSKALTSTLGGRLADRFGRGALILTGWGAFALSFALFALLPGEVGLWLVTVLYGLFTGLGEGAERALISDFSGARERGTAFGWYNLVLGLAAIPAGLLFGGVWHYFGSAVAFAMAALLAAVAVALLCGWAWPKHTIQHVANV